MTFKIALATTTTAVGLMMGGVRRQRERGLSRTEGSPESAAITEAFATNAVMVFRKVRGEMR